VSVSVSVFVSVSVSVSVSVCVCVYIYIYMQCWCACEGGATTVQEVGVGGWAAGRCRCCGGGCGMTRRIENTHQSELATTTQRSSVVL
jgi:hypothetical protein